MIEGLYINSNNTYIENAKQETGELRLLAKGDGVEIMEQHIHEGKKFYIYPADTDESFEYFQIINGKVILEDKETVLTEGDYFYVHQLTEPVYFRALTNVKLLYISTEPLFHLLSNTIMELKKVIMQVEDKDLYTKNHCKRVQEYCGKIANKFNLNKNILENLIFASLFHDLGKVNIPIEILNKPGKLSDYEFECIKQHPTKGKELIKDLYYKNIGTIIEQHHERLDGSGYPKGLKDDEITFEAKIIAVVDTYDAMTTDRPYRKAFSPQIAVDELRKCTGTLYDERIVEVFIEVLREEGLID